MKNILPRKFYGRDTSEVARNLLGKVLVKFRGPEMVGGIILETEAYYGEDDPASHAYGGKTPRSEIMFGKPGIAYVYMCYGMYYLLNVVTENEGKPGAVLIRALKPIWGIDIMKKRRNVNLEGRLTDGPGKLTIALGIDIKDNGADIVRGENRLYLSDYKTEDNNLKIIVAERIGIKKGEDRPLRFLIQNK
ncbi:MAG: DNA-3-methyladenine glycosylase [Actinobacteria bacterium]|nr:DNA-3-methyladenine glycosylase [Actinomycetota bacterium]MBL7123712.1 DNA-3-methyladenine glycosylase [Actinomycetota bacterium]